MTPPVSNRVKNATEHNYKGRQGKDINQQGQQNVEGFAMRFDAQSNGIISNVTPLCASIFLRSRTML